jgi:hypothetical protein
VERAAEQGTETAQTLCGKIYATGCRSVPQNWTTPVKWWRKAAVAGQMMAQKTRVFGWFFGCGDESPVVASLRSRLSRTFAHLRHVIGVVRAGVERVGVHRGLVVVARFHTANSQRRVC